MFKHLMMSFADRRRWRSARTAADLGELTAQWLEGKIASRPGYAPGYGPDAETTESRGLVRVLAACNRAGFVTEASQPGTQQVGADGAWWTQCASVTGFVSRESVLDTLHCIAGLYGLQLVVHGPGDTTPAFKDGITVTERDGQPWTTFGARLTARDIRRIWRGAGHQAVTEVEHAWQVTLAHPYAGNYDTLFSALLEAFRDPATAQCAQCGCTESAPCEGGCQWAYGDLGEDLCSVCAWGPDDGDSDFDDEPRECDLCGAPYYHGGRYCSFGCEEADAFDPDAPAESPAVPAEYSQDDPWSSPTWG